MQYKMKNCGTNRKKQLLLKYFFFGVLFMFINRVSYEPIIYKMLLLDTVLFYFDAESGSVLSTIFPTNVNNSSFCTQ